ncbi:hypothetical protein SAMN05428989_0900 [Pseudoxanthomonas sp. GM95]|uniref:hypothetical protein n=1 Tax=Pseudoxanthomonas sp. GM95 TaxID=1881043 RepID=UPI0008CCFE79|nr:hypothetical protein [Pseudoxanthomonas sp. GM95]SEK83667.1 hypothetical protein SAMN05428989_0900 [Pseudoxanthomonas sp. GM95]
MRTFMGLLLGSVIAAAVLAGAGYGYQHLYRLPAGADFYTVSNLAEYALAAPREALACLIGGCALAGLLGGWAAARMSAAHRGGAAITVGALVMGAVIALAVFVPFPAWVTVASLLLPIPMALCATRMATPRLEV